MFRLPSVCMPAPTRTFTAFTTAATQFHDCLHQYHRLNFLVVNDFYRYQLNDLHAGFNQIEEKRAPAVSSSRGKPVE